MTKTAIIAMSLALAVCATVALAQVPGPGGAPGGVRPGMMGMTCPAMALAPPSARMIERADMLQLTDDQKTKLTAALTRSATTLAPLRQAAGKATMALRTAVMGADTDPQKLAELVGEAQKAEAAIIRAEIQAWTETKSILSADQMAKLRELMASRMGTGGTRNRPGGGGGEGAPPPPPPPQ